MLSLSHYVLIMTILNTHIQRVSLLLFYDMCCCICQLLRLAYQCTHFLILQSHACRSYSLKFCKSLSNKILFFVVYRVHYNEIATLPQLRGLRTDSPKFF